MAVELVLPSLITVLITALVDSVNPCAIGVLILLISTLLATAQTKFNILKIGLIYIGAVYLVYFLLGLGLMTFLSIVPLAVAQWISIAVGSVIVVAGIIEIKDFFWYGEGFSLAIAPEHAKKIHKYSQRLTIPGIIFLGAFVAAVELPCTGGPYLAITLILSQQFNLNALLLLAIYNVIFVLPLVVILLAVFFGKRIQYIKMWKHKWRAHMRLAMGILLIALAWLLILIANGVINLG